MSRIGKLPVLIPSGVDVTVNGSVLSVQGTKGELTLPFDSEYVSITIDDGKILVTRKNDSLHARSCHGLYRNLAANLVKGVTEGFSKTLEIKGVGYRAALKGTNLELNLGYSHPIVYALPKGVTITFPEKTQGVLVISGIDKQLVGQVAAEIRSYRKPEPYKGKGIKYADEVIARKAGKSVTKKA